MNQNLDRRQKHVKSNCHNSSDWSKSWRGWRLGWQKWNPQGRILVMHIFLYLFYRTRESGYGPASPNLPTDQNVVDFSPLHALFRKILRNRMLASSLVADPGFPRGHGANPRGYQPIIWPNFPKNCMKMKKFCQPPRSTNAPRGLVASLLEGFLSWSVLSSLDPRLRSRFMTSIENLLVSLAS